MNLALLALPALTLWILSRVLVTLYRLTLHPLAKFPGPKWAAVSSAYEFYFNVIKGGQYVFEIDRMHRKYGPIIRVSPHELHVNDPAFIEELYPGPGKPRDKYSLSTRQFGMPESAFATEPHNLHRLRRGALSPYFSKAAVADLEPAIYAAVDKLATRLEQITSTGDVVDLTMAFSCLTTDIVTQYAFSESSNLLDSTTFTKNFHEAIIAGTRMGLWAKYFPIVFPILRSFPMGFLSKLSPDVGIYLRWQESLKAKVCDIWNEQRALPEKKNHSIQNRSTIFHELFYAKIPDSEKHPDRMWQEGQVLIGAGTETTAWALTTIMFFVLDNPGILAKLTVELETAIPETYDRPSCHLYNAVVQEGLRLSHGVSSRLQRINPQGPMIFRQSAADPSKGEKVWKIPIGTPVGMTSVLVHLNEDLFPEPFEFLPERWLDEDGKRNWHLDKYILAFSKGTRQCLAINLAFSELYMGTAVFIRRLGDKLQLFETNRTDVDMAEDCFVPLPRRDSKGVRVTKRR